MFRFIPYPIQNILKIKGLWEDTGSWNVSIFILIHQFLSISRLGLGACEGGVLGLSLGTRRVAANGIAMGR